MFIFDLELVLYEVYSFSSFLLIFLIIFTISSYFEGQVQIENLLERAKWFECKVMEMLFILMQNSST